MLEKARKQLSPDLSQRVDTMQYNFFTPQPIQDAGAYFLRHVLHNWNDDDCAQILRNMVPALEKCGPGTPLLISETIIPKFSSNVSRFEEYGLRQMDIMMFVALGAKQRSAKQFELLIKNADERFEVSLAGGQ